MIYLSAKDNKVVILYLAMAINLLLKQAGRVSSVQCPGGSKRKRVPLGDVVALRFLFLSELS